MHTKQLRVKSRTENLSLIRDFVSSNAQSAGLSSEQIDDVILAVDEACTNVIKHAYKFDPDKDILIEVSFNGSFFTVTITDNGIAFNPDLIPSPDLKKYHDERRVGGLGMYLMKTLMDEVAYTSEPGKYNKVSLRKKKKV